jgi:hypothetical protein
MVKSGPYKPNIHRGNLSGLGVGARRRQRVDEDLAPPRVREWSPLLHVPRCTLRLAMGFIE